MSKDSVAARFRELQAERRAEEPWARGSGAVRGLRTVVEEPAPYGDDLSSEADVLSGWLKLADQEAKVNRHLERMGAVV